MRTAIQLIEDVPDDNFEIIAELILRAVNDCLPDVQVHPFAMAAISVCDDDPALFQWITRMLWRHRPELAKSLCKEPHGN